MDQSLGSLYAELALKSDKLEDGSKKSTAVIRKLNSDIDKLTDEINAKLETIGKTLSLTVTAPLTIMGYQAVKTFTSFEQAMQNTYSVVGATSSEMEMLRATAEKMGADTRFSASQAADALYSLGSAGFNAAQSATALDGVLKLAGATQSDLAYSADTLTSVLSQYNLKAGESAHVADVFAQAIGKSKADMDKLSYSMKYTGTIASGLGMSLESTVAALSTLYDVGLNGENAGTTMRSALLTLSNDTAALDKGLANIGLTFADVDPKAHSFADTLDLLKKKGAGVSELGMIFDTVATAGMAKLVEKGGEAVTAYEKMLVASDGAAAAMQKIQNMSLANTVDEMKSAWEGLEIELTNNVKPALAGVMEVVTEVIRVVTGMPEGFQVSLTAALTFAAVAGPILLVAVNIKKLKNEMALLNIVMTKNPFMLWATIGAAAISVIAGIVTAIKKANEDYQKYAQNMVDSATKIAEQANQEGDKGRNINSLLDQYDSLSTKVNKSAEEQSQYNTVIQQLGNILPGVITSIGDHGEALTIDAEAARKAAVQQLKIEEALNRQAIAENKLAINRAKLDQSKFGSQYAEGQEKLLKLTNASIDASNKYLDVQKDYDKVQSLINAGGKENLAIAAQIAKKYETGGDDIKVAYEVSKTAAEKAQKSAENYAKSFEAIKKGYGNANDVIAQSIQLTEQLNANLAAQGQLGKIDTTKKLLTQKEAIEATNKAYRESAKSIDDAKKEADLYGDSYNAAEEKAKALEKEIRTLLALKTNVNIDASVTTNNPEVQKLLSLLRQLKIESEAYKDSLKDRADTSQGAQLIKLEVEYKAKIQAAKDTQKDTYDIEQEWMKKRLELLDTFHEQDLSKGMSAAKSLSSTLKGTGKTLEQWIVETKANLSTEFQDLVHTYQENELKLANAQTELDNIDLTLFNADRFLPSDEIAQFKLRREALVEEVTSLNDFFNTTTPATAQDAFNVDVANGNLQSAIADSLPLLAKLRQDQLKCNLATKEGSDEYVRLQGDIDAVTDKIKKQKQEQADAFTNLVTPVNAVGQGIADSIAAGFKGGLEEGVSSLVDSSAGIIEAIGAATGDPMTAAITKAVGAAITIIKTVYDAIQEEQERQDKVVADSEKEATDAAKEKWEAISSAAKETFGDVGSEYAKILKAGNSNDESLSEYLEHQLNVKGVEEQYKKLLETTAFYTTEYKTVTDKAGHWSDWSLMDVIPHWVGETYKQEAYQQAHTYSEALAAYYAACRSGNEAEKAMYLKFIKDTAATMLKDTKVSLSGYVNGLDSILSDYVKGNLKLTEFKKSLKEKVSDAVLSYLMQTMVLSQINKQIDDAFNDTVSPKEITADEMNSILATAENTADGVRVKWKSSIAGMGNDTKSGLAAISDEWAELGTSIESTLTESLGDAAYNADWSSFRSSFAEQMKKALISSAMETSHIASAVKAIIDAIMDDGTITPAEITSATVQLKAVYDYISSEMSPLADILNGLTDAKVETKTSGTIIQQLSGADRDYLGEMITAAMKDVQQSFDFTNAAIQNITATQLIINAVYYNHTGDIIIQAGKDYDIKALMGELITQALGSR